MSLESLYESVYKWAKVLSSPIVVMVLGLIYLAFELRLGRNDFDIFLAASNDLVARNDLYANLYFGCYHYYYSLFFASVIATVSCFPLWVAKGAWMLLNMILLFRVWKLIKEYLADPKQNDRSVDVRQTLLGLILFLISMRFIRANLHYGQVTIVILFLSLFGLKAVREKKWWGGIVLAIGINLKWMPIVFIPYLLYRKEFRAAGISILTAVALWFLPLMWLETDYFFKMTESYWQLINPAQTKHILDVEEGSFHGLTTWISTLFHKAAAEHNALPWRRHLLDLPVGVVVVLVNTTRLIVVALTLLYLRGPIFTRIKNGVTEFFEWSWLLAIIPLIFPHQQHYAFLLMVPALSFVLQTWMNGGLGTIEKVIFAVVVIFFNLSLWLGAGTTVYNHYKIVTIGGLLLLWILYRIRPSFQKAV